MKKLLITCSVLFGLHGFLSGQSLEENVNVVYMKANVLFDSGRFDESVRLYNQVLNADENFLQALIMRGKAKYELGAYLGTKKDLNVFVQKAGITREVLRLMAITEIKLKNFTASQNYLTILLDLDPYDRELYRMSGDVALEQDNLNLACKQWSRASNLGDVISNELSAEHCNIYQITPAPVAVTVQDSVDLDDFDTTDESYEGDQENDSERVETIQMVEIDDGLSIELSHGLGERKIDHVPEIFMISSQSGKVVIDICISETGSVIDTEFDRESSSIFQSGIVSLAIRKSREFQFFPSIDSRQCGKITFLLEE